MSDIIGKFFAILFGAMILFIMPVTIIALKQDNTSQAYIDNAVVEFVDNVRGTAQISTTPYEKLVDKVDAAAGNCDIDIYYFTSYVAPDIDAGLIAGTTKYNYKYHLYEYDKMELLTDLYGTTGYENNIKYLNDGDYIKVVVSNANSQTLGNQLQNFFTTRKTGSTIYTSYGGYVGNGQG